MLPVANILLTVRQALLSCQIDKDNLLLAAYFLVHPETNSASSLIQGVVTSLEICIPFQALRFAELLEPLASRSPLGTHWLAELLEPGDASYN